MFLLLSARSRVHMRGDIEHRTGVPSPECALFDTHPLVIGRLIAPAGWPVRDEMRDGMPSQGQGVVREVGCT